MITLKINNEVSLWRYVLFLETGGKIVFAPFFIDFGMDVHFTFVNLL